MALPNIDPSKTKTWKKLTRHRKIMEGVLMKDMFAGDKERFTRFSVRHEDILLDYSKNRITEETMLLLLRLAIVG